MCGIEQGEYDTFRQQQGLPQQSVEFIEDNEAKIIYDRNYWTKYGCAALSFPLSYVFFQYLLNITTAAIYDFQDLVGAAKDGRIGHQTIDAALKIDPLILAQQLLNSQRLHYNSHNEGDKLKGLLNRCDTVAKFCGLS